MLQLSTEWLYQLTNTRTRSALPVLTYPGHKLIHETVQAIVTNPKTQFACVRAIGETFPMPAALTVMDLSLEAEAFGCPVQFYDHDIPAVTGTLIQDADDLSSLMVPPIGAGRVNVALEAVRLVCEHFSDRPVLAGMIGPFSLTVRLRDMTQVMMDTMMDSGVVHGILEKATIYLTEYALALKEAGASGVFVAEPAAGLLAPDPCDEFSSVYMRHIINKTQDESFAVILHNCGQCSESVQSMLGTGARALHFGNAVNMIDILDQLPDTIPVFGNLDPAGILCNGTEDVVYMATTRLLNSTAAYPNYILSSGCDIPPETPLANMEAFYRALQHHNTAL